MVVSSSQNIVLVLVITPTSWAYVSDYADPSDTAQREPFADMAWKVVEDTKKKQASKSKL